MLELQNISFGVETEKGARDIIRDVSLKFEDDKFTVITGPNGGGKSTLARLIAGIEKPDQGRIIFNGEETTVELQPNMTILEATTSDRGDPNYQFEAMVTFDEL